MKTEALLFWASKDKFSIAECEDLAKDLDAHTTMEFDLVGPTGRLRAKWQDAYYGFLTIEGMDEGTMTSSSVFKYALDIHCENLTWPGAAQGIEARSDETPQAAQPEGQEPGPQGCAETPDPNTQESRHGRAD